MTDKALTHAYRKVFLSREGGMILTDIASSCYAFSNMIDFSRPDRVYFNEGMRNVFLMILDKIGISNIANIVTAIQGAKLEDETERETTIFMEE